MEGQVSREYRTGHLSSFEQVGTQLKIIRHICMNTTPQWAYSLASVGSAGLGLSEIPPALV